MNSNRDCDYMRCYMHDIGVSSVIIDLKNGSLKSELGVEVLNAGSLLVGLGSLSLILLLEKLLQSLLSLHALLRGSQSTIIQRLL